MLTGATNGLPATVCVGGVGTCFSATNVRTVPQPFCGAISTVPVVSSIKL